MKLKNLKMSKQINIWMSGILLIAIVLTVNTLVSMEGLWLNTAGLFEHPLTTRRAVAEIEADVLLIHRNMMQLVMEENNLETEMLIQDIDAFEADAYRQIDLLYSSYLGPKSDIDETSDAIMQWRTIRTETIRLLRTGQLEDARSRVETGGIGGAHADKIMSSIINISDFARSKGNEFYLAAQGQRNQTIFRTSLISIGAFFALVCIGYLLKKSIVPPIVALTVTAEAIRQGKLDTRTQYEAANEIGMLSKAFNAMAETIETEIEHKDNTVKVSSVMFREDSLRQFCQELLKSMMLLTTSQIGAIYFLNEQKDRFEPYESIGARFDSISSFSAIGKEGEFGTVLATKKVQHISEIPSDIHVVFSTVSGDFIAKEIITIPVIRGSEVFSLISIASIKSYSPASVRLINSLTNEISARLSTILASEQVLAFSRKLQDTNAELQQQANELAMQTDELTEQNTELEMQKNQLHEASRLKTNFLSNMSHELRTPLNSVIALSGVLSRKLAKKIPDVEYSYLEIIERNGKSLLKLINDILDISRIEAGHEEVETTKLNAMNMINEVISMIKPQADQKNIEIVNLIQDTELPIISDADKLRHILQNLIGNAVKFTDTGRVEISAHSNESGIEIKVVDTGIGIAQKHLPYIFDEFRQADSSTSRRFGGTGLGLAISKKYANLLGGTISVESIPNRGSEFTLILPLRYAAENRILEEVDPYVSGIVMNHALSKKPSAYDASEKTVLLVEDSEAAIIQIRDILEETGCQVQVASNAGEALVRISQAIPNAIILDLMMPDVDGFKVLEILRNAEATANVPVLILTAKHITKEELKFLKRNNIHQLIQKGDVKYSELQNAVKNMLYPTETGIKKSQRIAQTSKGKPVVLVVEDNPDNMVTVKALLAEHHIVLEAINALEGIELAKEHVPDLILMDIALPDISGIDAFKKIREIPQLQQIPVIALTASAMTHDREAILSHGFDAFIAKPIMAKEFFKEIQEVLYGK